jgi:hypothetical protein
MKREDYWTCEGILRMSTEFTRAFLWILSLLRTSSTEYVRFSAHRPDDRALRRHIHYIPPQYTFDLMNIKYEEPTGGNIQRWAPM